MNSNVRRIETYLCQGEGNYFMAGEKLVNLYQGNRDIHINVIHVLL